MDEHALKLAQVVAVSGSKVIGLVVLDSQEKDQKKVAWSAMSENVHIGALVKMRTCRAVIYGMITRLWTSETATPPKRADKTMEIDVVGEILHLAPAEGVARFQRGVSILPGLDAEIFLATRHDLACLYEPPAVPTVPLGALHQEPTQSAFVAIDNLLGRHFAILGTTGVGKSCAVASLLRAVLDRHSNGHVVLLDPHNEYSRAFSDRAELLTPENLQLPYWLLNFEEAMATFVSQDAGTGEYEAAILKEAILDARRAYARMKGRQTNIVRERPEASVDVRNITVDTPVPYYLTDVVQIIEKGMGRLEKPGGTLPYLRLQARIEALRSDRRFAFMFGDETVDDVLADILSRLLRVPVSARPITIIDLSGVPSEIVDVVISVTCRLIFDFALWNKHSRTVPVLLVCEEAHRYVPRDERLGFGPTRRAITRIALEGRKYGVSLCLVSHRPSELSSTMLSQCNTIFAMRMANRQDQEFVQSAMPEGTEGLVAALPALRTQEAIVVGEGVPVPMRLRFGDLDEAHRPQSATAAFSAAWQEDQADQGILVETVDRWRHQRRT